MNDSMIRYFLTVGRYQSFTKAAEVLFVAQPSVSKRISALEAELGVELFKRMEKPIALTEAGKLYYDLFSKFKRDFDFVAAKAQQIAAAKQTILSLGYLGGWNTAMFFSHTVGSFSEKHPHISVAMESNSFDGLVSSLELGHYDIVISLSNTLRDVPEGIVVKRLTRIPSILLFSENHPLAKKKNLQLIDFKDEVFYAPSYGNAAEYIKGFCHPYGFEPKIQFVLNTNTQINYVQNVNGVALNDYWTFFRYTHGFRHLELDAFHDIGIAWRKNDENFARDIFVNELLASFADGESRA